MKDFVQAGDVLTVTNGSGANVASGGGILVGTKVAIAAVDIANGATGSARFRGVFDVPKNTGGSTGGAQGVVAYWDNTNKKFTAVSSGNTLAGYFAATCADGDAECLVKLTG